MLENIRRIGIFMIVAQTVIHFAAGKQYEKYMKIIAGVIILLQFVSPFVSSSGEIVAKWQEETERMMSDIASQSSGFSETAYGAGGVQEAFIRQMEEEIKTRLNELVSGESYFVADVAIDLEEVSDHVVSGGEEMSDLVFRRVEIMLTEREESGYPPDRDSDSGIRTEGGVQQIRIEEIVLGSGGEVREAHGFDLEQGMDERPAADQEGLPSAQRQEYRRIFAQALGIAEDRVEVIERGGG